MAYRSAGPSSGKGSGGLGLRDHVMRFSASIFWLKILFLGPIHRNRLKKFTNYFVFKKIFDYKSCEILVSA